MREIRTYDTVRISQVLSLGWLEVGRGVEIGRSVGDEIVEVIGSMERGMGGVIAKGSVGDVDGISREEDLTTKAGRSPCI